MTQITAARIHYNEQGTPVSDVFDDVYFSNDSGLHETQYVFIDNNHLQARWPSHPRAFFHIIETGFGTGLNFLLAWRNFQHYQTQHPTSRCQRLYFSTFEKFPLAKADLAQALNCWPELADLSQQLLSQYPPAVAGCHRLQFDNGAIVLDLWLGDVHDNLPQLAATNLADAWFLDGFAPSKNPEMWQDSLFLGMARLSQPGTTVATFTSAGIVRRGLQQVGFTVKKMKGYGRKREMAVAVMPADQLPSCDPSHCDSAFTATAAQSSSNSTATETAPSATQGISAAVLIVGGGLAALLTALSLIAKGRKVHLICQDQSVGKGASHNRQGALYPQLQSSFSEHSKFHLACFGFANRQYRKLLQQFNFPMEFCGVLQLACNEQLARRFDKIAQAPAYAEAYAQPVTSEQASEIAGVALPYSGLYFAEGGWVAPQRFCQAAFQFLTEQPGFQASLGYQLQSYLNTTEGVELTLKAVTSGEQHQLQGQHLVLCTGHALPQQASELPLNVIRGQVSHIKAEGLAALKTVVCHQGYITPQDDGYAKESCIGATFDRDAYKHNPEPELKTADDVFNLDLVNTVLKQPSWFADATVTSAKAAFRTTAPDHLPVAGKLADGTYMLGALGARGLLFAPLLAEYLAARLCDEPEPLSLQQQQMLSPCRFKPID